MRQHVSTVMRSSSGLTSRDTKSHVRPDDDRMTVETCCLSWSSFVNKYMYCCAGVHS